MRTTLLLLFFFCGLGSTLASRGSCEVKVTIPLLRARTTLRPTDFSGVRRTLAPSKCSYFSITPLLLDSCAVIEHLKC